VPGVARMLAELCSVTGRLFSSSVRLGSGIATRVRSGHSRLRYWNGTVPVCSRRHFELAEMGFLGERRGRSIQEQLLYSPIRRFGSVDFVLRGTREGMRTGELAKIASRPANHAQNLAI
jgi:hypothetical protein